MSRATVLVFSRWISEWETLLVNAVLPISFWTFWFRRKSIIASFSASCFSGLDALLLHNSTTNWYSLSLSFSFSRGTYTVIVYWQVIDKILPHFFYRFCKIFISFKNTFLREIKLWVLSLYTDLIGRLGVSYKSEGSKGVCRVSGVITVSRLATKLSGTEDVQFSTWVFLTKLQVSSKSLSSCASFCFIL